MAPRELMHANRLCDCFAVCAGTGEEFRGKVIGVLGARRSKCWFDGHRRVAFGQTVNVLKSGTDDEKESARVVTIAS